MEEKSITTVPPIPTTNGGNNKKRNAFSVFKAILLFRQRPTGKSKKRAKIESATNNGNWKKIVGSMRPLHLQDNPSSPVAPQQNWAVLSSIVVAQLAEDALSVASPSHSSTSGGTMSQYASANNLQELDKHDECDEDDDEDEDKFFDGIPGDEMIDAKADEFIAQFYEQMRLQRNHRATKGKGKGHK